MHHVLALIVFQSESADAGKAILLELALASRKEAGCVSYALYQQADAPHVFRTVEAWKTEADAAAHMQTEHIAKAIAVAAPLFAAPPEILGHRQLA